MLYILAILLPPVAVLFCGKPIQAFLNIFLSLLLWFPGVIHAILIVHEHYADRRNKKLIAALRH
jgi:uncharacterized membrane protein YqaE (UPF0057 family)